MRLKWSVATVIEEFLFTQTTITVAIHHFVRFFAIALYFLCSFCNFFIFFDYIFCFDIKIRRLQCQKPRVEIFNASLLRNIGSYRVLLSVLMCNKNCDYLIESFGKSGINSFCYVFYLTRWSVLIRYRFVIN